MSSETVRHKQEPGSFFVKSKTTRHRPGQADHEAATS